MRRVTQRSILHYGYSTEKANETIPFYLRAYVQESKESAFRHANIIPEQDRK